MKDKIFDDTSHMESLPEDKIKLLDVVALTEDFPEHNLKRGEVGTVVEILADGEAYEVEFSDDNGQMYKCTSFLASQLRVFQNEPLNADPMRQAHAQLKGYLYQIWHSVDAWLNLAGDEILYLECAEDFDIVSGGDATVTQVKHTQHNITLRSKEVIDAINNFWELQTNNSDRRVKYRFLTRSKIGMEQGNPFGKDKPGLELWCRCSGDEAAITKISEFLQNESKISDEVKDFFTRADPDEIYKQLIEPISWDADSKDVCSVEQSISDKLFHHGNKLGLLPFDSSKVLDALLHEAFTVATQKGNRELTKKRFSEIFQEETTQRVSTQHLRHLQMQATQATMLASANATLISGSSDITIQSQSPILTDIPPLYPDVIERTEILKNIQTNLQSEGIVVIQGGTGKGKTTLAKLIAEDLNGSWFWLNFTNKNSLQILQYLQQLANEISSESAQINVVLDDLNLQPQQLREYEEILGVVIDRLVERGAKLLITSQYEPPVYLIRRLGLPSTVIIGIPNFTIPEIEQFAEQMGCPSKDAETWTALIQAHTGGHPRLVHAWFVRLRAETWDEQNIIKGFLQPSEEIVEEREAARQLLTNLPENQREFLYRLSLMSFGFSKDYAKNIAEIPEPISYPGDVFSQLVGPWIDQIDETYYTISPLLRNSANQVWTENKIKDLHAHIADAILKTKEKTKKLTITDLWAVLTHSMVGQNKGAFFAAMHALMTVPYDDWKNLCQEFSWIIYVKTKPPEELFPGDAFLNQLFRSRQYRIAAEVEPEFATKILEIWDKETKSYEPRQSYFLSRLMIATEILKNDQMQLPARRLVGYLKEMIDIKNLDKKVWKSYFNSMEELKEINIDESNFFSFLFSFIMVRQYINAAFLDELINGLDELEPKIRRLLLGELENYNIDCRIVIENICLQEENSENPDWTKCLQVYDNVIEKSLSWGYPHIAALSVRGKSIIHDEYLEDADTAHKVINDFTSKVGRLLVIEDEQAVIYFRHEHYQEALDIYERILPEWHQLSERFGVGTLEEYIRASICAANLDDWKKAATFFEEGAKKNQQIENTERYIGAYADAGFAHFKAGNMFSCIRMLHMALENFEKLPQDNTDIKYFTLKKRLECTIKWVWMIWCGIDNHSSEQSEPAAGFCSEQETNEKVLDLPDSPIGYSWLFLAQIEYRFGHETTVFQHALQTTDREEYPMLSFILSILEAQYDFRNETLNELPARIQQLANACDSIQKHLQSGIGNREAGIGFIPIENVPNFTSVESITVMLVAALVMQLSAGADTQAILSIWRANSSGLPIEENMTTVLNLIDRMLSADQNHALKVMKTQDIKPEERVTAALKVVHNNETSPENLFHAHTLITTYLVDSLIWLDPFLTGLARLLSAQWLEKIEYIPLRSVFKVGNACKSSEAGKKKIGQILLAAHTAVSVRVAHDTLQQFRAWTESESMQGSATRKNPAAQRLIKAMEKPPHLTDEDIEVLNQSIEEGKIPINFDSPFDLDEDEDDEQNNIPETK